MAKIFWLLALITEYCVAGTVRFSSPLVINPSGDPPSFTFSGILTQASTIDFQLTGVVFRNSAMRCANAAGIAVLCFSQPVIPIGQTETFVATYGGTTGTWNQGALLMTIAGVGTVQVFPATAANGLGSNSPPIDFTLTTTSLAALGFPNFSVTDPVITFLVAYPPGTPRTLGSFTLTQVAPPVVPAPSSLLLVITGFGIVALFQKNFRARRRRQAGQ
jgi:hypothetical protein